VSAPRPAAAGRRRAAAGRAVANRASRIQMNPEEPTLPPARPRDLAIVGTGIANIASVAAGLRRLGATVRLTEDPREVRDASHLVLPGVGAFGAAMAKLRAAGLVEPLRERIDRNRPTLAVCLGLQLLARSSEECPDVAGLGVLPVAVERFRGAVRVPQLGWNRVRPDEGCRLIEAGYAYFANSFRIAAAPGGWAVAWAEHGGRFVAAIERGPVLACQFHPELSGAWGRALLERWLQTGG
jgi:glutamine amidotransferase